MLRYDNKRFAQIEFLTSDYKIISSKDLLILFQITGKSSIEKNDSEQLILNKGEFIVCFGKQFANISSSEETIICEIKIDRKFLSYFNFDELAISCGPDCKGIREYREIVHHIYEILNMISYPTDLYQKKIDANLVQIIELLSRRFSTDIVLEGASLVQKIKHYVDHNFYQNINQAYIADYFHITPQYLSKIFKAYTGSTLLEYLNVLRVTESAIELLNTKRSITEIAFDYGFNNINSYNRTFKKVFKTSPNNYRKIEKTGKVFKKGVVEDKLRREIDNVQSQTSNRHVYQIDANVPVDKFMGFQNSISMSNIEKGDLNYVLSIYHTLGVKYVKYRLTIPKMGETQYYLLQMERELEKFIQKGLYPILQLEISRMFKYGVEELREFFLDVFVYFSNIISFDNVNNWKIQFLINSREDFEKNQKILFSVINSIKQYSSSIKILFNLPIELVDFLISIVQREKIQLELNFSKTKNTSFLNTNLLVDKLSDIVKSLPLSTVYLDSFDIFFDDLKIMNDTIIPICYMSELIAQLIPKISGFDVGKVKDDLSIDGSFIHGDNGLSTWQEIPKPKYHFFEYVNKIAQNILFADKEILISRNSRNDYSIFSHQSSKVISIGRRVNHQNYEACFVSAEDKKIIIHLKNMKNGKYRIKYRSFIDQKNDLIYEWRNFDYIKKLNSTEVDYILKKTEPILRMREICVENGRYDLEIDLLPNEFCYIHIIYIY